MEILCIGYFSPHLVIILQKKHHIEPARRLHLIRQKHSVFSKSERSFDGPKALIWIDHPTDLASMNNSLHDV